MEINYSKRNHCGYEPTKGKKYSDFRFSFKLTPRNEKEAQQVKLIIRAFKRNMAPQAPGGTLPGSSGYTSRCTTESMADRLCPSVKTKIFSVTHGEAGVSEDANNTSYNYTVTPNGGNAADRKNLYFRLVTTGQSMPTDGTSPTYYCRYTTTYDLLYGGEGWREGDTVDVWMAHGQYRITIKFII